MITKECLAQGDRIRVTFELPPDFPAQQVDVVGEFSDWEPTLSMAQAEPDENWKLTLELAAGRCYRFRYLVDGQHWLNEVYADDHWENPYGSYDSVIDLRRAAQGRAR